MTAFSYQASGLGGPALRGQGAAQPDQGLDVLGVLLDPPLVVRGQAGLVVVAEEDLLDLAADLAVEPAIGPELAEQRLEVAERRLGPAQADLQVGGLHGELDLAERVGDLAGEGLEARQGLLGLALLGQGRGDLLLDPGVVGEELLEPGPDGQRLVGLLGPLVDPAQRLEDLEQVVPRRACARARARRPSAASSGWPTRTRAWPR